ncbi:hypothetical protein [Actinacidiphila oryziradicis]|uniref:hypothetical protein n=1 Tax=Actinacidiphila oryziradicis TaxID=2571141 RepID=UPI001FE462C4|nr:hypothetical protein [Actinacidiphila oryziradicis]
MGFRFRCTGCDHSRTDVSYLPDLSAYLDDLLRNRERIRAAVELDDWARAEALPSEAEISRARSPITRIRQGMNDPDATAPSCSACPACASPHSIPARRSRVEQPADPRHARRPPGRLPPPTHPPPRRPEPGPARRSGDHPQLHRPRRRRRPVLPLSPPRPAGTDPHRTPTRPDAPDNTARVSRASLHAELLASQHRTTRQAARIRQLERKLSEQLGQQSWQDSGSCAPDDIDALQQKIINLEQQITDVRLHLEEREQDLTAARAANRALMTEINATRPTR